MKKTAKLLTLAAVMIVGTAAFAGPRGNHKKHERDGLDLAYGIVNLVMKVINPTPAVIHQPVVINQAPAIHHHQTVIRKPAPERRREHRPEPPRKQNNRKGNQPRRR